MVFDLGISKGRSRSGYDKSTYCRLLRDFTEIIIICSIVDEYVALDKMLTDHKKLI